MPTVDLARTVVRIGNCSGADADKFAAFGLAPVRGKRVKRPASRSAWPISNAARSTTAWSTRTTSFFILEGVQAWVDAKRSERRTFHANGDGAFAADGESLDLREEMTKWKPII